MDSIINSTMSKQEMSHNNEEKEKHTLSWVPFNSIPSSFGPVGEMSAIWPALNSKNPIIFTGEGKVINSENKYKWKMLQMY